MLVNLFRRVRTIVPESKKSNTLAFILMIAGTCLDNLNISGTMTGYFSISAEFGDSSTTTSWVLSAYSLTLGAFIIISGKLVDVFGPENVFMFGMFFTSIFALISAAIKNSIIALIIFRAFQGLAASTTIPAAFAFIGASFEGKTQERALSVLIIGITGTLGLGLILGGAFSATKIGYKGLYYLTFAIAFLCSVLLAFFSPEVPRTEEHKKLKARNLDYGGSLVLVIGLLLVILGLTEGGESWKKPSAYVPIPVGVVVVGLVIVFETWYIQRYKDLSQSNTDPALNNEVSETKDYSKSDLKFDQSTAEESVKLEDWRVSLELLFPRDAFKVPNVFQFLLGSALAYMSFIAVMATMVQYYLYVEIQSPLMAGVKALPLGVGLCFGSAIYRDDIAQKVGNKFCCVLSAIIQLTMGVWLSRLDPTVKNSYWKYEFASQFLFAYGVNLYFQVYWNAVMKGTPVHLLGVVSGILQTAGQLGLCLGNAIFTTVVGELVLSNDLEYRMDLKTRFNHCFYMLFASSSLMAIIMLTVRKVK